MGGRGAASGISDENNKGGGRKKYGTQYTALLTSGNIKYVKANSRNSETLFETMTRGRVYAVVGGKEIKQIIYFDDNNRRSKTIDLDHSHSEMKPHVHHGYEHNENDGIKGATNLTPKEKRLVEKVLKIWDNYLSRR